MITTQRQSLTSHRANRSCGTCFVVMTTVWHALHGKNYAWRLNKSVSLTATQQSRLGAEEVRVAPSVSALVVMSRLSSSSYTFPLWTLILCSAFLIAPVQGKPMFYLNSAFSLKLTLVGTMTVVSARSGWNNRWFVTAGWSRVKLFSAMLQNITDAFNF